MRTKLSQKRVERQTERVGEERVAEREAEVVAWENVPLMQRDKPPEGVQAPDVACVLGDGGRLQLCDENPEAQSHWHEYKGGVCQGLKSEVSTEDPCPEIPETYLQPARIEKLAREITTLAAREESGPAAVVESDVTQDVAEPLVSTEEVATHGYDPPRVIDRDVVATRQNSQAFGRHLAARAWHLGLFASPRKAFVSDGGSWLWTVWARWFKAFGFVPILDFIHALTRVYAAALAGRPAAEGWPIYERWITWVWQGEVAKVIVELAARQQELGLPTDADGDTSPRQLVSETLTYLQNQQSRMHDPEYRKQGLPLTSAHMESTIKLINRRIKGSEKYWCARGSEAMLQLTADYLSTSQPMAAFWPRRAARQTGYRTYAKRTPTKEAKPIPPTKQIA